KNLILKLLRSCNYIVRITFRFFCFWLIKRLVHYVSERPPGAFAGMFVICIFLRSAFLKALPVIGPALWTVPERAAVSGFPVGFIKVPPWFSFLVAVAVVFVKSRLIKR